MSVEDLPKLPARHAELAKYIADNEEKPVKEVLEPYRKYEARLREVYAQDRQNPLLNDQHLNVLPLFTEDTKYITTRARDLSAESDEEKSKYIMSLPEDKRRPHGSPATVANLGEFQKNFNVFSESSLVDMDWSNVVAAGSSVINCLLPVPAKFNTTKRKLREYYHEKFCPASDVDLFLYGLTHEEAIEKIKRIERAVRDALLNEVTVVRTKYAITIASQYPVRHIQPKIVLRVYKSVSEILTGFDIDAAGGAYDGKQVYVTPRALGSFITQINHVDLSRRSPSYENRLSKYSHRDFEVYWPDLDRSRIDPTIFERSFQRTLGLARLLVLERLPTTSAREAYLNKRRTERGRPTVYRGFHQLGGNIKDAHEDEVADWLSEEDVSNYHTFTVPYGKAFHAKRIEKLCYTRDLLLNAEWNQPKEREVYLHRHPAFFGRVEDVIEDCCGYCPVPQTDEEKEVAEKEAEIYISGKVAFLIDDPGRQQIGSFNPLTEQDWTDMAYVGNTARLCQSIVAGDVDDVLNWLSQEGSDPNTRDYTGRAPLHLAVMVSTPEVVKCLIDHGARLTARLADGRTPLHLASARGNCAMIKALMEKSIENEEAAEDRKDQQRKEAKRKTVEDTQTSQSAADEDVEMSTNASQSDSDGEMIDGDDTEADAHSFATGSFVKIDKEDEPKDQDDLVPEESDDAPDYYQIDVLGWDTKCSPLHLAIVGGHEEAVGLLCDYGADVMLPVKLVNQNHSHTGAILTLTLCLSLPLEKAKAMTRVLLKHGATSAQAETNGNTALHHFIRDERPELIDELQDNDKTGFSTALNHLLISGWTWNPQATSALQLAIQAGNTILVMKLLNLGSKLVIDFETWLKAAKASPQYSSNIGDLERNKEQHSQIEQPILTALAAGCPDIAIELLNRGADPNTITPQSAQLLTGNQGRKWRQGVTILDITRQNIKCLNGHLEAHAGPIEPYEPQGLDGCLSGTAPGTYKHWMISEIVKRERESYESQLRRYKEKQAEVQENEGLELKRAAISELISGLKSLESVLLHKGAKPFAELYPDADGEGNKQYGKWQVSENNDVRTREKPEPCKTNISFSGDEDLMTDQRNGGYIDLMEAAWSGNIDTIKALTLQAWGTNKDQPPLKAVITDHDGNNPFSVAFLRGHHQVATGILEIVKAQWTPAEKSKVRYRMETQGDDSADDDEDYDSEGSEGTEPRIVTEEVDQKFTIENLGEMSMQVKSHVKPLTTLCSQVGCVIEVDGNKLWNGRRTLFNHVITADDQVGFKVLLDLAQHWAAQEFPDGKDGDEDEENESGGRFSFPVDDFVTAINCGNVKMLGTIIRKFGAGIPLDHLVKKSGVEMQKKPKSYPGLTVYGKKRKDWATAGRNIVVKVSGTKTPPLLQAACAGSLESVEYFLSDTPHRQYSEFIKSKAGRDDPRLKHLKDSPGGFERAISKWLGGDNELVIHCAVTASPRPEAYELLEYLVETCPSAVEKKNTAGETPLMVACRLGRTKYAKILIDGNADQSTRNNKGENILHAALAGNPAAWQLKRLLDLLDPELRSALFLHRRNLYEDGSSPIQAWVAQVVGKTQFFYNGSGGYRLGFGYNYGYAYQDREEDVVDMLDLLLEYSRGEGLDMLNAAGDTSLHAAIMRSHVAITKKLVDFKPSLLYRENAVGRTPAEMANDILTGQQFEYPRRRSRYSPHENKINILALKDPKQFALDAKMREAPAGGVRAEAERHGLGDEYAVESLNAVLGSMGRRGNDPPSTVTEEQAKRAVYDICRTAAAGNPGVRRLVSLNEANDVARRLGEQQQQSRYFAVNNRGDGSDDGNEEKQEATEDYAVQQANAAFSRAWSHEKKDKDDDEEMDED